MEHGITWIGIDAHKKTLNVAMRLPGEASVTEWQVANEPKSLVRLVRKIEREAPGEIRGRCLRLRPGPSARGAVKARLGLLGHCTGPDSPKGGGEDQD